jgi:cytochrome c biogenesis protein CcmG/thiol:disulfide interchange protein DsbE
VGINYKDKPEKTIKWLKKLGNPYSVIAIDKKGNISIDWGVYGLPETFVVSSQGLIKFRHVGPVTDKIYKKISLIIDSEKNGS